MWLSVAFTVIFIFSGWNGCTYHNGQCPNLCLAIPDSGNSTKQVKCECPTHYTLVGNTSCEPPKSFLLFSQKTAIRRLLVNDSSTESVPDVVLPIRNPKKALRNVKALDYDPVRQHIYWISGKAKSIKRAKVDGTEVSCYPPKFLREYIGVTGLLVCQFQEA